MKKNRDSEDSVSLPPSDDATQRFVPESPQGPYADGQEPYDEQTEDQDDVRQKHSGCMAGILYFLSVVGVSVLLAMLIWLAASDVLSLNKPDREAVIVVAENFTLEEISLQLHEGGIIRYPWLFRVYGNMFNAMEKIVPGEYLVASHYDYHAIVSAMGRRSAAREIVSVTIPEGYTILQIFELLEARGVCTATRLMDTAETHDFNYSFLKDLPPTRYRLEGYFFPDTYEFYVGSNPVTVLNKLLANFDRRFPQDLRDHAAENGMTVHQALTIASLIERETGSFAERPIVSSVIHNRLNSPNFPRLEIDATVLYCLPEHKDVLSIEDTQVEDPYNTYRINGLPPGPICSPGNASIRAALAPDETNYFYYVLTADGTHRFSRTLAEHQQAIDEQRATNN